MNSINEKPTVIYIDDEQNNLIAFEAAFRRDFKIFTAINAATDLTILSTCEVHVLITDQRMPGVPGIQLLEEAVKRFPSQSRILVTAYPDKEVLAYAVQNGHIFDYVLKPWRYEDFKGMIFDAYKEHLEKIQTAMMLKEREEDIRKLDEKIRSITTL